jgi:hypothetical protein
MAVSDSMQGQLMTRQRVSRSDPTEQSKVQEQHAGGTPELNGPA